MDEFIQVKMKEEIKKQSLIIKNKKKILFNLCKKYAELNSIFKNGSEVLIKGYRVSYIVDNSIYNVSLDCITYNLQQKGRKYTHYKLAIIEKDIYLKSNTKNKS